MKITLSNSQQNRIQALVDQGFFINVSEAVDVLIAAGCSQLEHDGQITIRSKVEGIDLPLK